MFEYEDVSGLDAAAALGVLEHAQVWKRRAEVQEALAMVRVVKTYRHQIGTDKVQLAGEGTGLIDDFACLELAAALHRSVDSVTPQVIDLLNLEVRLPRLWEQVVACGVPVWQARQIARDTAGLSLAKARWIDDTIGPFTTRLAPGRLTRFVQALVVQADPAAAQERWNRAARPRIQIGPCRPDGLRDIYGWLTAADATYLDAALTQLASILDTPGTTQDVSERRATALGILATPARALALLQHSLTQPTLPNESGEGTAPEERRERASDASRRADDDEEWQGSRSPFGCAGHTCGRITVDPDRLLPKATLIIHLSDDTLTTGTGLGRCEQLGPLTIDQIRQVLGHTRVTVQPVFNPNGIIAVDSYDIPAPIRRAVLLRHPYEIFPYGTRPSTGLDLDHTQPYRWGPDQPAGQTRPDNLGPQRRKAHRAKTHAGWHLHQPEPGLFHWTSPLGRHYLTTPAGLTTDPTTSPTGTHPWDNPLPAPLLPDPPQQRRRTRTHASSRRTTIQRR
ncbi:MAG: 13E12 repeat family protein [Actinobacteria bacterium]|nr:13E12 repeat family protein [Actinomycetota bacterium]